jgi:hypothetical protein
MTRVLAVGLLFALTLSAAAQSSQMTAPAPQTDRRGDNVRVQVNVSFLLPAPSDRDAEEVVKAQESARRILYQVADRECTLLKELMATECRMESVNVNINRQRAQPQQDYINANAQMVYRVLLK